jgi:hypothetical protein
MASPQAKKLRRKLTDLGYTETITHGMSVWKLDNHSDIAVFDALTKVEVDGMLGMLNRAHRKLPKVDADVVSKADQAAFDAAERARKQQERATYLATKDRRLGGLASGLPEWMVDQLEAAAQSRIDHRKHIERMMAHRPFADITD